MRMLQKRKNFVMSHPKKFEIANKILDHRTDKKCITFSATIKDAESFKTRGSLVLHSKQKKLENQKTMDIFNSQNSGILSTSKSADAGVDIKGLSVGIILSCDSSKTRTTQRIGRIIRFEQDKISEMFTLVIGGTIEEG
jgi:superfamily II DNA or RNA helicase